MIDVKVCKQIWKRNDKWQHDNFDGQLRAILILFEWGRGLINLIRTEATYEYDGIGMEIPYPYYGQEFLFTDEVELHLEWIDETIWGDFYEMRDVSTYANHTDRR